MNPENILAKVGGSVLSKEKNVKNILSQFQNLQDQELIKHIILICGGGAYANFIRKADKQLSLGDDLSHWLAISAMDYNSYQTFLLSKKLGFQNTRLIRDLENLRKSLVMDEKKILFFTCYEYLIKMDELPHSWQVTSDSIAYYLSVKLGFNACYLIKNVDGIFLKGQKNPVKRLTVNELEHLKQQDQLMNLGSSLEASKRSKPIDFYLLDLIQKYDFPCYLINGSWDKKRILEFFDPLFEEKVFTSVQRT
ncbi:MAG: hypothetical protein EU544_04725 [Promethearchaeota archaeon]|nr:MAG: hypothetical protein EU544_04725 [Candidatus Lokiarchaeota archaeon]